MSACPPSCLAGYDGSKPSCRAGCVGVCRLSLLSAAEREFIKQTALNKTNASTKRGAGLVSEGARVPLYVFQAKGDMYVTSVEIHGAIHGGEDLLRSETIGGGVNAFVVKQDQKYPNKTPAVCHPFFGQGL